MKFLPILILLFGCSLKQDKHCQAFTDEANRRFELFLFNQNKKGLPATSALIDKALQCDSSRSLNYWLKVKIEIAKENYDSALLVIRRFEYKFNSPDIDFAKAQIFGKLNQRDSAVACLSKAIIGFDLLLSKDSTNSSLMLSRLQAILYLKGRKEMLLELDVYKQKYPNSQEFEDVRFLLDSI